MTFSIDLLCARAPVDSGIIRREHLFAVLNPAFQVGEHGPAIVSAVPDLTGDLERNPLDTEAELAAVFDGLIRLQLDAWGTGWKEGMRFEDALAAYCVGLGRLQPGMLAGYSLTLAGPGVDIDARRFQRTVFQSLDALLQHRAETNEVLLVPCRAAG